MDHHGTTRFFENFDAYLAGQALRSNDELSRGATSEEVDRRTTALLDSLDDLCTPGPKTMRFAWTPEELTAAAMIEHEPISTHVTAHDRLVLRRAEIEAGLAALPTDHERRLALGAELADVQTQIRKELVRSTDDGWRSRRNRDEWRATTGRDEYNEGRRQRTTANAMTPKAVLAAESDEERRARVNASKAASKARRRAAMTDEEREEARRADAARKRAFRAQSQS